MNKSKKEKEMDREFERKNKEIIKKFDFFIQKMSPLTAEKIIKLLADIQPIIRRLEEMNESLKKGLEEKK